MKRRPPPDPRDRIARKQRAQRDANESPELDDAELEEIEAELARRMLELES